MKNQRLVEAMNDLETKRINCYNLSWSAYFSTSLSTSFSAYESARIDKQKVLEIIKARLK